MQMDGVKRTRIAIVPIIDADHTGICLTNECKNVKNYAN